MISGLVFASIEVPSRRRVSPYIAFPFPPFYRWLVYIFLLRDRLVSVSISSNPHREKSLLNTDICKITQFTLYRNITENMHGFNLFTWMMFKKEERCKMIIWSKMLHLLHQCCILIQSILISLFQRFMEISNSLDSRKTTGTSIPLHQAQVSQVRGRSKMTSALAY